MTKNDKTEVGTLPAKMTDKQRRFIEEYLVDLNGTKAAIRAGYSEKSAAVIAHENLRKPDIRSVLDARLDELSMSSAEIIGRMTAQASGALPTKTREVLHGGEIVELSEYDRHTTLDKRAKVRGLYGGQDRAIGKVLILRSPQEMLIEMEGETP